VPNIYERRTGLTTHCSGGNAFVNNPEPAARLILWFQKWSSGVFYWRGGSCIWIVQSSTKLLCNAHVIQHL